MNAESLTAADADEAIALLCTAFTGYPLFRLVLQDSGADYPTHLSALVSYFCNKRLLRGWPVRGVRIDGKIAAVALISVPEDAPAPVELEAMRAALIDTIGEATFARMQRYEEISDLDAPDVPAHFLGMIGVHPERQGLGLGRVLLDDVQEMARRHPVSQGVCLNTETPGNVALYEHVGYRTLGKRAIDSLETWTLFRAND